MEKKLTTYQMAVTALMAAVMCVLGPLSVPIGAIPISLSNLVICFSAWLLGPKFGTLSVAVYLALGAVGLPVFSGYGAGLAKLAGPTGGYLVGFLFTALTMWGAERWLGKSAPVFLGSAVVGQILCYLFGSVWYYAVYTSSSGPVGMFTVLGWCVFPFLLPDAVKLALAWLLSRRLAPALRISRR